jgi:hypothetical protein
MKYGNKSEGKKHMGQGSKGKSPSKSNDKGHKMGNKCTPPINMSK